MINTISELVTEYNVSFGLTSSVLGEKSNCIMILSYKLHIV